MNNLFTITTKKQITYKNSMLKYIFIENVKVNKLFMKCRIKKENKIDNIYLVGLFGLLIGEFKATQD